MPHDTRSQVIRKVNFAIQRGRGASGDAAENGIHARKCRARTSQAEAQAGRAGAGNSMEESLRKIPTKIEPANLIDPDEGSGSDVN
jgi:hypothetical protein